MVADKSVIFNSKMIFEMPGNSSRFYTVSKSVLGRCRAHGGRGGWYDQPDTVGSAVSLHFLGYDTPAGVRGSSTVENLMSELTH